MMQPGITPAIVASSSVHAETGARCAHDVQFYFDDAYLIRSLSDYVRTALGAGSSAIIVATAAHRAALADLLRSEGVRLSDAVDEGRYVALDAAETLDQFLVNGFPDEKLFQKVIGDVISCSASNSTREYDKVVIFGEMVTLLWQRGEAQVAIHLEQLWNRLAEHYSFHLRCGYPISSFDQNVHKELFNQICTEHVVVIPAEGYSEIADHNDPLRTIALLQQTEQALKTEAVGRRVAEEHRHQIQHENQKLNDELRHHQLIEEELRRFTRRLLTARDEEQRRIAAELHENMAQLLAALSLYFGVMYQEKASLNPRLASAVAKSRSVSDNLLSGIRRLSQLLHPPTLDDMGLGSALKEYVDEFANSNGIVLKLEISPNLGRFPRNLEITVFRIVEEALGNVPRSSDSLTTVRLARSPDTLTVEIENQSGKAGAEGTKRGESRFTGIHARVMEYGGSVQFTSSRSESRISVQLPLVGPARQVGATKAESL